MLGTPIKKLIIVTGEKETAYAELLSSLISLKDDNLDNEQTIGITDGTVEAVVWTEKVYNDNKIQLSSNAKVIFVGKTKATEPFIVSIRFNKSMEKYGVKIGWLGNKAIIYTEPSKLLADKKLYDEFYDSYIELSKKFDDSVIDTESIKKAKHSESLWDSFGKGAQAVGGFVGGLFSKKKDSPIIVHETEEKIEQENTVETQTSEETTSEDMLQNERANFFDFGAKIEAGSLIPDQLFRYAIFDLYLNKLLKFLG